MFVRKLLGGAVAVGLLAYLLSPPSCPALPVRGIVVITGASTGIGRHAAEALARAHPGWLVLAGVRREADAAALRALALPNLRPLHVDVADGAERERAASEVVALSASTGLPVLALINNAGVLRTVPVELHDVEDARRLFDVNVWGALGLSQLLLPALRQSHGRLVMVSSMAAMISTPLNGVYSASKFALESLSDALRRELGPHHVSVSIIQPGMVQSAIFGTSVPHTAALEGSARAREAYPELYTASRDKVAQHELATAAHPSCVSDAIEHALSSPQPRARYPVAHGAGLPAWFLSWLFWGLPDRVLDRMLAAA